MLLPFQLNGSPKSTLAPLAFAILQSFEYIDQAQLVVHPLIKLSEKGVGIRSATSKDADHDLDKPQVKNTIKPRKVELVPEALFPDIKYLFEYAAHKNILTQKIR